MMKKVFTSIFFSICLYTSFLSYAQTGIVSGKLTFEDGQPVAFATVFITSINKHSLSDELGSYTIEAVPYGKYMAQVSSLEIEKKEFEIESTVASKPITTVLKRSSHTDLDEVSVIGESYKTQVEKSGFAVNIIDTKEASLRNIQTNELLNTTVGVKIRQNGGLGSEVNYSLNGLSGNAVRIFIDGIPISAYGNSFNLNSIPPSMIKEIEVYKGVVPGHLADDALGGAINIVLQNSTQSSFNASVSYGSFNTLQASVNGLYRFKESGFTVKGSLFHNYSDNDYEVSGRSVVVTGIGGVQTPVTARRFNDAYRSSGGMLQIGYTDVKWADQFLVGFTRSSDYKEIQHGAFMTITPYKDRFMESDAMLMNLTYQKNNLFVKGLDVNINGLYGKRNRMVSDTVAWAYSWNGERAIDFKGNEYKYTWGSQQEGGPTLAKINRNVSSIRTGISYTISKNHRFMANHVYSGIDRVDSDELRSVLENTFQGTRDLQKNIISLTYELNAFDEKLKANVFGKYYQQNTVNIDPEINEETNEIVDEVTSANTENEGYGFTLSYAVLPTITLLTSAEKAVRLPNESEVFGNDGDNVVANPSIRPELSNNINLGFRLGTYHLNRHDFTFSSNLFTRNIKDRIGLPIETSSNVNDETILYENQGNGTSKGFDAQLDYTYNNNFGFNFNVSRFDLKIVNRGVEIDVPNTPFFTMNGSLRYSFKDLIQKDSRLNLFYTMYFTDEFSYLVPQGSNTVGDEFFKVPQQLAQDLGLSYVFPSNKLVMSFDVKNIFDQAVYDNLSVQKPGRAFYLKLNYRINNY
ncbi:TonB-dependent receptor [Algoriphagus chordae]|uniref:Outer membrane receptor protein involved in Fe transport n=1 Tax=Algoriphagus chordae TaxID=237019 RepID=A0A2W7R258_9BACT|nr:TonB-dependent receptor plug domain-containing protein [Algoriphagus chordae]PZX54923.1 outer membrane receptor protein involved in Fe transport [Algoriphagus chordae]